jgi:hypothetical protein
MFLLLKKVKKKENKLVYFDTPPPLRGFTIFLGWWYFLECRRYQTISARGLGSMPKP